VRALVVRTPGDVGLDELATPAPTEGHVLIRPVANGLCGTDLELIDGTIDAAYVRYPLTLGHEWVGHRCIEQGGDLVDGELVVVEGIIPCGVCEECGRGATNRCVVYDEIGFTRPGALATYILVPEQLVHNLSPDVAPRDAVLTEPMAVVWRALRRAAISPGARCLVIGDGTIGLLCAYLLQRFNPKSITMLGARSAQHDLATRAGVSTFTNTRPNEKFDVVVEAAGQKSAVEDAIVCADRGGVIVLLGLPPHGTTIEVAPDDLVNNDLTLQGSFSYTRSSWREIVELLNDKTLQPSFLITHEFTLDGWNDAVQTLRAPDPTMPRGKVLVLLDDVVA